MFVDKQRIDLLNQLIDARVDLTACVQLRKAKGYMSVSKSNHLRDDFFKPDHKLHDKSLRLSLYLDQEERSVPHHTGETLATTAVRLISGYHDCPTAITVNTDRPEGYLMSLTLSVQNLQKHAILERA